MRNPLLVDILKTPDFLSHGEFADVLARLRSPTTRRFCLGPDAVAQLAVLCRDFPQLVVESSEFARPPYDRMWVEYDARSMWEQINGRKSDDSADDRVGYFIDNGIAWTAGSIRNIATFIPYGFELNSPWSEDEQRIWFDTLGTKREQFEYFVWGRSIAQLDAETRAKFVSMHKPMIMSDDLDKINRSPWAQMLTNRSLSQMSGDLRNLIAILLVMNRPHVIDVDKPTPAVRTFVKGKSTRLLEFSVVHVRGDAVAAVRTASVTGDRGPVMRHEVRGHFRTDETWRAGRCMHTMEVVERDQRWRCSVCGGQRWWVKAHERGDASRGYKRKEYVVD